ncbi:glycosyltransferase [Mycolicibacterium sp. XJ879]
MSFIVSQAAGVIANSEYTLQTAAPHIRPGVPAQVIASPIGLAHHRPTRQIDERVKVIGMLARIQEWKGQELLMRAFADTFRGSSISLELAGSPAFGQENYLAYLRKLGYELGVGSQIKFLGHISEIWPLLDSWDICVHASLHTEPLGQNVLQYLAACRPTVAANAGGPAEWIEHGKTGLLYEPADQAALSATLSRLVKDNALRNRLSAELMRRRPVPSDSEVRRIYWNFFSSLRQ